MINLFVDVFDACLEMKECYVVFFLNCMHEVLTLIN